MTLECRASWGSYPMTIGYTTGVFDMFHIGHLRVLERARSHCDFLIVGVTTDELSMSAKGKAPIIPFEERAAIVSSLRCVDRTVPQESMDKLAAWEQWRFDVMFVGDDWKGTEKWTLLERDFAKRDVDIVYFPYTADTSSTLLRDVLESIHVPELTLLNAHSAPTLAAQE
jgi:glycerol-3-phosphate cytidylyltransferase